MENNIESGKEIIMSISNLGAIGYQPQVTSFTAKKYNGPEDFKPGLIMPEKEEKKNKHTVLKTVATLAVVVGAAVLLKKHGKTLWNKLKGLFNKGSKVVGEGGKTAETTGRKAIEFKPGKDYIAPGTKIKVNTPAKPAAEVVRNIETSTANSSARKAVEQAIKDTPTKAQQAAYDESIRYVAPTAEQKAAIKANNAVAARETAIAHQIQNAASPESVKALEKAKQGMSEVNTSLNGLFESNGAKLTVKNGKIVKIQTPDGRAITKELNIAKYEHKHGIDLSKLTPASTPKAPKVPATPAAPAPATETVAPKKFSVNQQQEFDAAWIESQQKQELAHRKAEALARRKAEAAKLKQEQVSQAWKEYTSKQNVPTTEQIFAQRNADAAKLKQEQVSQAWAEHTTVPKQTTAKTEQNIADIFAQRKAEEAALKKQQMDEMWAAAGY